MHAITMKATFMMFTLFLIIAIDVINGEGELSCVTCDSSTNVHCAREPQNVFNRNCSQLHSKCFTRIQDGATIRGCVADTEKDLDELKCNGFEDENGERVCETCEQQFDGCNTDIFPSHRIECLQCEGVWDDNCYTNSDRKGLPCPLYVSGDRCYIWKSADKKFKRGCLSDVVGKECKNKENCYLCEGASCNYLVGNSTEIRISKGSRDMVNFSYILLLLSFGSLFKFYY